ncbi:HEAT repeat domain-containing protein [Gordonia caeni]|uniref:HEAT repeat domain-containing protein n=1 Tax=Gordonia caeni TaxID=1007097 RepID=A0ABP7PLG1_9ACTN
MTTTTPPEQLRRALGAPGSSGRLRAALGAGSQPDPDYAPVLVERCAVEPDFFVRDMLTWALVRHPVEITVPLLVEAARRGPVRARSQALHTLSKIGDPRGWSAIDRSVLLDADDDLARSAWRAAVVLAPDDRREQLAATLATRLGTGDSQLRRSLSRALAALGPAAAGPLASAATDDDPAVRAHAAATAALLDDPDADLGAAAGEVDRYFATGGGHADR